MLVLCSGAVLLGTPGMAGRQHSSCCCHFCFKGLKKPGGKSFWAWHGSLKQEFYSTSLLEISRCGSVGVRLDSCVLLRLGVFFSPVCFQIYLQGLHSSLSSQSRKPHTSAKKLFAKHCRGFWGMLLRVLSNICEVLGRNFHFV